MERNPSRLHVAILDEELPFPLTSGKRIRTYNLLSRLADRHRLTYLCHRNADADEQARAEAALRSLGIRIHIVDRAIPKKSGLGFYARLAGNLLSSRPYSVATHFGPDLERAAKALAADDPPDLWHVEWTPYAEYFRRPPSTAPWLVMAHNVESLIWRRYVETEQHPLKRWYIRRQYQKFRRFEEWAYSSAYATIAVSEDDARLIRSEFGGRHVKVVDNGVDPAYFAPDRRITRNRHHVLFLGSLDWRPNLDAVHLLLDEIFPKVRAADPRAVLQLVGRKPPPWLKQQVLSQPGVELHADVADVRPFLAQAGMLAVPLRIGGGSRLKILEALAAGVPVITTSIGVEGLQLESQQHVTIADGVNELAAGILRLINHPCEASEQAECGREQVLAQYDWEGLAGRLEKIWLETMGGVTQLQNDRVTCLV